MGCQESVDGFPPGSGPLSGHSRGPSLSQARSKADRYELWLSGTPFATPLVTMQAQTNVPSRVFEVSLFVRLQTSGLTIEFLNGQNSI
jgi:hypothetical protein